MAWFKSKKKKNDTVKRKTTDQLNQEIQSLMEQLNIPQPAREALLKKNDAEKELLIQQFQMKMAMNNNQRKESGKDWSNKLKTDNVDGKLLKTFQIVLNDSDKKFAMEFIEELGLKRLSRLRSVGGEHDLQILMIFKAIMDTAPEIKNHMIDDDQCINNIVAKVWGHTIYYTLYYYLWIYTMYYTVYCSHWIHAI